MCLFFQTPRETITWFTAVHAIGGTEQRGTSVAKQDSCLSRAPAPTTSAYALVMKQERISSKALLNAHLAFEALTGHPLPTSAGCGGSTRGSSRTARTRSCRRALWHSSGSNLHARSWSSCADFMFVLLELSILSPIFLGSARVQFVLRTGETVGTSSARVAPGNRMLEIFRKSAREQGPATTSEALAAEIWQRRRTTRGSVFEGERDGRYRQPYCGRARCHFYEMPRRGYLQVSAVDHT